MNGLVIVLIAIVVLAAGYLFYGRWLANKWGLDPKAKTPAFTHEDGQDYVPSSKLTVFAHQFSSIAGAGPVTGPILASVFGWVPVLLWLLIGGLFFGAVQDFGALYASVKNDGKSMGMIIEKYIGRTGRKGNQLCKLRSSIYFDVVHRCSYHLWTDSEKSRKDERVGTCSCSYWPFGCNVCHRYASSNVCNKDNMDLRRYGLPLPCIGYANVAFDGAS